MGVVPGREDLEDAMSRIMDLLGERVQEPRIRFTREEVESTMAITFS